MTASNEAAATHQDVTITRVFNAPRDLVFATWTQPEHVQQWWGPGVFTNPLVEMDVRPGGSLLIHMQAPDGTIFPTTGTFEDVRPPDLLVLTTRAFEDEDGNAPLEVRNTITFEDEDGATRLTMVATVIKAAPEMAGALSGMEAGWAQSFDSLAEYLTTL
jgi:uncharacterized protein YndB with AHSA1/START domain